MPLSNAERQRRWRKRHPGLASKREMECRKKHWDRYKAYNSRFKREQYHKIQDEAGCYMRPREFYPGYRILKALVDAEVVEI